MLTDKTHTTLNVELQISLLGGANGPLMYLTLTSILSSSFQIVLVEKSPGTENFRLSSKLLSVNPEILTFNLGRAAATQKSYF